MRHSHANTISLTDSASVRRDAEGVPVAFRVLRKGVNVLTIDGAPHELVLTDELAAKILDYHRMKGEQIPIDAEHFLQELANVQGVDEADVIRANPKLGEQAAEGMASLVGENGEIWANVTKWANRAKELLTASGTKLYGYFSPVIRGLKDGRLRITSLALTNVPALNELDVLAAKGEHDNANDGGLMKTHIEKLATLLNLDVAALTAEKADLTPLFEKVESELTAGAAASTQNRDFLASVKDALALTDGDSLASAAGKVLSIVEKSKADAAALTDAQGRIAGFEQAEKQQLIKDLKANGKLSEGMTAWAEKQDAAALREFAKNAPVIVPLGREVKAGEKPADADDAALTDSLKTVAAACGLKPEDVAKTKMPKIGG